MGVFKKSKAKAAGPDIPEGGPSSPALSGGIAAYRRTLGPGASAATEAPLKPPASPPRPPETPQPEAGLLKSGGGDSKYRRAAKFLILIGGDEAAGILSQLPVDQVERISKEIASIRGIGAEEAASVLAEFRALLSSSRSFPRAFAGPSSGGVETARRLLHAAFGPERGEAYLTRTVPESRKNPFAFLEDFSGEQIALLLKDESVAATALVLSRLSAQKSAAALVNAGGGRKAAILRRIARMERTDAEVLEQVAAALREKARLMGGAAETVRTDGLGALTAILKSSDPAFGDRLLRELEEKDGDLGRNLKERLYTLEDVVRAEDRPIQEKLRSMPDRDIVLLLKGRSPKFTEKIYANLSSLRAASVREEAEIMGAVPKAEADAAARDFLGWFRLNREEGRIILMDDEDVI
ncbi:MAG: flagellar motor switch protein FliG [Spirochaetaceae bacterium]|jgi:flagellar motor switch protein FliG|nr:flagellar motor switch protein FliG [Spirochaetaceae bacterium]